MKSRITRTAAALALTFASAVGAVATAGPAYASGASAQGAVGGPSTVQPSGRMSGDIQASGRYTPRIPEPEAPAARPSGLALAPLPLGVSSVLVP